MNRGSVAGPMSDVPAELGRALSNPSRGAGALVAPSRVEGASAAPIPGPTSRSGGGYRSVLRNRRFLLYQVSAIFSSTGYAVYAISIPWIAYLNSGSFLVVGLVLFLEIGIYACTFLAAPLVDRAADKRVVFLIGYPIQAVAAVGTRIFCGPWRTPPPPPPHPRRRSLGGLGLRVGRLPGRPSPAPPQGRTVRRPGSRECPGRRRPGRRLHGRSRTHPGLGRRGQRVPLCRVARRRHAAGGDRSSEGRARFRTRLPRRIRRGVEVSREPGGPTAPAARPPRGHLRVLLGRPGGPHHARRESLLLGPWTRLRPAVHARSSSVGWRWTCSSATSTPDIGSAR